MNLRILLLFLPLAAPAQKKCDSIRFEMIRETVNFLATDTKISGDVHFKVVCSKPSYSCLEASINEKKLHGVIAKVRVWDAKKQNNTPDELHSLRERIWKETFDPENKSYRKKLPVYKAYEKKMTELLRAAGYQAKRVKPEAESPDSSESQAGQQDSTERFTPPRVIPADTAKRPLVTEPPTKKESSMQNNLLIVALAAAAVAIVTSFLALLKKPEKRRQLPLQVPEITREEFVNRFKTQDQAIRKLDEKLGQLEEADRRQDDRILELEENKNVIELYSGPKPDKSMVSEPVFHQEATQQPANIIRYAKFRDLDGGFSPEILSETQNGEQTYMILISGDQATYEVVPDPKAQTYALQNFEYLSDACDIRNQVQAGGRIHTISPGTLSRSPENNWNIGTKAVIEFV